MAFQVDQKKIAKNTIALYIRMAITMVISFFTARVTLQQLGVEDYGLNNLVGSIVSMFSFINGSMGTAVQRFYSIEIGKGNEGRLKRVFGTGLYLHIIVAVITLLIAEIFAIFFLHKMNIPAERMAAAQIVFQISIISLSLNIINVPYAALLRARELFDKTAMVEIVQAFLRLGILYLLVVIDYDKLIALSILGFFVTIYYVGTLTIMARRFEESHSKPTRDKELMRKMLSFISMLLITVLCQMAKTQGLVMLINIFFGLVINAAYAVAVQVSNMVNTFAMSFKQSMIPQMMAAYGAKDLPSMHKIINMGTKITFLLLMMISMPVIFEANFLLKIWLKTPPEHAAHLVQLVLIYINISSFTYFQYQGVHATGNLKAQQFWVSSLYLLNIIVIYLVFKWGANFETALYVNMVISLIQCVVNLIYAHIQYNYSITQFIRGILFPCFTLVVIVSCVNLLITIFVENSFYRMFEILAVTELSLLILGYFVVLNRQEKIKTKEFVIRMYNKHYLWKRK